MNKKGAIGVSYVLPLQVTDSTFTDSQEQEEWFHAKTSPWITEHAPKDHSNWRLSERWFVQSRGRLKEKVAKVDEIYDRAGADQSSAQAMLNGEEEKPKKDPHEKHMWAMQRTNGLINKLSRSIASLESALPGMKRSLEAGQKVKAVLHRCCEAKTLSLDQLEDCRQLPSDPVLQEDTFIILTDIQKNVQEHLEAIKDVINMDQGSVDKSIIKTDLGERPVLENKTPHNPKWP